MDPFLLAAVAGVAFVATRKKEPERKEPNWTPPPPDPSDLLAFGTGVAGGALAGSTLGTTIYGGAGTVLLPGAGSAAGAAFGAVTGAYYGGVIGGGGAAGANYLRRYMAQVQGG